MSKNIANFEGLPEQKIREALSFIDYEDREEWVMAAMCLKHELGESGLDMWLDWSANGSTFNIKSAKSTWKSAKAFGGRTIGTLIHYAQNAGFKIQSDYQRVPQNVIDKREENKRKLEAEAKIEEAKILQGQKEAKQVAQRRWNESIPCESHPYLTNKDVMAHGTRIGEWKYTDESGQLQTEKNTLIIPLYKDGEITSLQGILPDGTKKLLYRAEKKGVYCKIGEETNTILICEGWATGATIHEATQLMTFVAIDSGNLVHVAKHVRKKYPLSRIVIAADNDQYKKSNAGIKAAMKACCEIDADYFYPIFKDISLKPTDFNDLQKLEGYSAVLDILSFDTTFKHIDNDAPVFNAYNELHIVADAKDVMNNSSSYIETANGAYSYAMLEQNKVPAFKTVQQIREELNNHPRLNPRTVTSIMCRAQWAINNRKRVALSSIKPASWGNKHDYVQVTNLSEFNPLDHNPVVLVSAPMGSGKTQSLIKPFSQHDKTFCAVAHRRSLISELANRLNTDNYDTVKDVFMSEKMSICLPSSMSGKFNSFIERVQYLAIDEVSQNVRFTRSKDCKAYGVDQEGVYMGLQRLINQSERIVATDASIDQTTIKYFEKARPDDKFTIVEKLPDNSLERICFTYDKEQELLTRVQTELMNGGKVWLSVESVEKATAIDILFSGKFKVILVTSDSGKTKKIKNFLSNIDDESRNYDLVVASPAISSGVSVEHKGNPHFTMIAGIASGNAICFSDFAQMLARVRYIKDYHVCLKPNKKNNENVTANTILIGQRQAALLEGSSSKDNDYSQTMAHLAATEQVYQADFANGFIWFLQYYCFSITKGHCGTEDYSLSEQLKAISSDLKETCRKNLCESAPISAQEAERIENASDVPDEELIALMAFKIRNSLGFDLDHMLTLQDIDIFEMLPSVDRFARLLGLLPKFDDSDKNIALRKFNKAQVHGAKLIFEDQNPKDMFFTADVCKEIITRVSSNDNRFLLTALKMIPSSYAKDTTTTKSNLMKELRVPDNCSKGMGAILEKFGLKWKRSGKVNSGYKVTDESYELMKEYAERRIKKLI